MLLYLLAIVLCLVCFHVFTRYGAYGRAINKIPGPTPLPLIGNILNLNKSSVNILIYLQQQLKEHYPIFKLWYHVRAMVLIQEPEDLKILLSDKVNITKGYSYKAFHILANSGLIMSTGTLWQSRRKLITPAFHPNNIKQYIEIVSEQGDKLIEKIKSEGDESVQSLLPICSYLTLSIIVEAVMGVKLETLGNKEKEYKDAVDYYFSFVAYRTIRPYIQDWMLRFFSSGRKAVKSAKIVHEFTDDIIRERREYHKHTNQQSFQSYVDGKNQEDTSIDGSKKRMAVLDLLLAAERDQLIDENGIRQEVHTFTAAGYDTTGMGLLYVLMLLAENKEAQELARDEVNRILAASGGKITMTEIQQMEYTERCVKESLRLFPSAPNITRTLTKDIHLKNAMVPAGSDVFIPIFTVHRNEKFWPDPLKFDPDRFLPEQSHGRNSFAYLPFSHGPRNCIGIKLALSKMKSFVARVLHNFYLEPVDYTKDLIFTAHVVLRPSVDPKIKFIKIKN